jgi:hypothetical protein
MLYNERRRANPCARVAGQGSDSSSPHPLDGGSQQCGTPTSPAALASDSDPSQNRLDIGFQQNSVASTTKLGQASESSQPQIRRTDSSQRFSSSLAPEVELASESSPLQSGPLAPGLGRAGGSSSSQNNVDGRSHEHFCVQLSQEVGDTYAGNSNHSQRQSQLDVGMGFKQCDTFSKFRRKQAGDSNTAQKRLSSESQQLGTTHAQRQGQASGASRSQGRLDDHSQDQFGMHFVQGVREAGDSLSSQRTLDVGFQQSDRIYSRAHTNSGIKNIFQFHILLRFTCKNVLLIMVYIL